MRVRNLLASACAATLLAATLLAAAAAPASAGTGASTQCSDGTGGTEHVVLTTPITVAVEVYEAGLVPTVVVCYGTGAVGDPTYGTGGAVTFGVDGVWLPQTTLHVFASCVPDYVEGAAPDCDVDGVVHAATPDALVDANAPGVCLVALDTECAAYVPGIVVVTDRNPGPVLRVTVLGTDQSADVPSRCIAVIASC